VHNLAKKFLLLAVEVIREAHCCLNKDSNDSYTEDQGRNTIRLPKTAYNSFSKV